MREFLIAIGFVLFLEGALIAIMGQNWPKMAAKAQNIPDGTLRIIGLIFALSGLLWVAVLR
ncbi:MAG: DUF2065 domain-containing protein [Alphaproteobacteria bacterium]|nr:DUF2065 domain-containing protein [Alphaproteobacteria bacterium]MDA7987822.1 DUF2065 domain-containing protein [Alphaproteobacteria bacterium]MDA8001279.1 DUF2065 domain-containing protein [Alphaproteobacteria bacterium]MDA8004346.1 DUF2065 domain-containing protein [Alphaproteobacteria bacterium]MDA8006236.1 DUF2065 domain-containing protein [Alphaproteobacteria bacterium]